MSKPRITGESGQGRPRDPSRDEAIIDASIDLLVRDGYDRVSMEGVAAAAGVGKGNVLLPVLGRPARPHSITHTETPND